MTDNQTPTAGEDGDAGSVSPIDLLRTLLNCAHLALASTEQGRTAETDEHVDAIERLLSAYRAAAQPEWATEVEQLRADCERKDREFATCERLLREAYDEIAKLRPPADETERKVVPAASDEIVAG